MPDSDHFIINDLRQGNHPAEASMNYIMESALYNTQLTTTKQNGSPLCQVQKRGHLKEVDC